jgi:hypothetical protein
VAILAMASSAGAWVPTPNRPRTRPVAKSTARYVPATSRADPASDRAPLLAILTTRGSSRSVTSLPVRAGRLTSGLLVVLEAGSRERASAEARPVWTLPSHWGATHLSI